MELPVLLPGIKVNTSADELPPDPLDAAGEVERQRAGNCSAT